MIFKTDLLWDSCVLLNVLSTGRISEILRAIGGNSHICAAVQRESFYIVGNDGTNDLIEVDLGDHFKTGELLTCDINGPAEAGLLVGFSTLVGDGEANTLAVAISRGWAIATDDRKARTLFLENNPDEEMLVSTSEIIRNWTEVVSPSDEEVRETLFTIERQARFFPPRSDPNFEWWSERTT